MVVPPCGTCQSAKHKGALPAHMHLGFQGRAAPPPPHGCALVRVLPLALRCCAPSPLSFISCSTPPSCLATCRADIRPSHPVRLCDAPPRVSSPHAPWSAIAPGCADSVRARGRAPPMRRRAPRRRPACRQGIATAPPTRERSHGRRRNPPCKPEAYHKTSAHTRMCVSDACR